MCVHVLGCVCLTCVLAISGSSNLHKFTELFRSRENKLNMKGTSSYGLTHRFFTTPNPNASFYFVLFFLIARLKFSKMEIKNVIQMSNYKES